MVVVRKVYAWKSLNKEFVILMTVCDDMLSEIKVLSGF